MASRGGLEPHVLCPQESRAETVRLWCIRSSVSPAESSFRGARSSARWPCQVRMTGSDLLGAPAFHFCLPPPLPHSPSPTVATGPLASPSVGQPSVVQGSAGHPFPSGCPLFPSHSYTAWEKGRSSLPQTGIWEDCPIPKPASQGPKPPPPLSGGPAHMKLPTAF